MSFEFNKHFIPFGGGNSVSRGWTKRTDYEPKGVTWHWTAGHTIESCRELLGGPNAKRKGVASAHYCVGRSYSDGIDQYVSLDDRSWHAGKNQILRWDGERSNSHTKGSRATIGIETVAIGYERPGIPAEVDWIETVNPSGEWKMRIQPWTDEQFEMMIALGRIIVERWPHIGARDHHGHHDICPSYKSDVCGLDFSRLLNGIYPDANVPDVWTKFNSVKERQQALIDLGYDLGSWGADGFWGDYSARALLEFQETGGQVTTGYWTSFTNWAVYDAFQDAGKPW